MFGRSDGYAMQVRRDEDAIERSRGAGEMVWRHGRRNWNKNQRNDCRK